MKGPLPWCMVILTILFGITLLARPASSYVTPSPDEPDIDGKLMTVGIAIAKYLAGLIPYESVGHLIIAILDAWEYRKEDYWDNIKDRVAELCGEYINKHNMDQVEIYKMDLIELLHRYQEAPIHSDGTYPDKNMRANAISSSIIANKYLIEAAEKPWSLAVDYIDIANIHVLILKDVAEVYTTKDKVSRWWKDLNTTLEHYISYGMELQNKTEKWRDNQIECDFKEASSACLFFHWMVSCYDRYQVRDHVSGYKENCWQLHPSNAINGSCVNHCRNYQIHINRNLQKWLWENIGSVLKGMRELKVKADQMARNASHVDIDHPREQTEYVILQIH